MLQMEDIKEQLLNDSYEVKLFFERYMATVERIEDLFKETPKRFHEMVERAVTVAVEDQNIEHLAYAVAMYDMYALSSGTDDTFAGHFLASIENSFRKDDSDDD